MKKLIIILAAFFLVFTSCDTTDPKPPEEKPPGYQEDIPWSSLADSPWPMNHGNPQSTGRSKSSGLLFTDTLWCKKFSGVQSMQSFTSVVVGNDSTIYVGSSFEDSASVQVSYLYAIGINGNIKWRFRFNAPQISTTPLIGADGTIYVASRDNFLYALSPNSDLKWKFDAGAPIYYMALNIDKDGVLYFVSSEMKLFAINPNGSKKWDLYLDEGFASSSMHGLSISPNGDVLYVPGISKTLYAISTEGKLEWSFDNDGIIGSIPIVESNGNILFSTLCNLNNCEQEKFICLDSKGKIFWEKEEKGTSLLPVVDEFGNTYFCKDDFSGMVSFDYNGEIRWRSTLNYNITPLVIDSENNLYANLNDNFVRIDHSSGNVVNTIQINLFSNSSPALAYNFLVIPSVGINKKLCIIK